LRLLWLKWDDYGVVNIVTRPQSGWSRGRIPIGARDISRTSRPAPTPIQPPNRWITRGGGSPRGENGHLHLGPRLRMNGATPSCHRQGTFHNTGNQRHRFIYDSRVLTHRPMRRSGTLHGSRPAFNVRVWRLGQNRVAHTS
jgi:hypothetical protein